MKRTSIVTAGRKGRWIALTLLAAVIVTTVSCGGTPSGENATYIGEDQAKSIALTDAGLAAEQVTFVRINLDRDDGRRVYDVEFFSGDTEYDYEVDALDGRILESDRDIEDYPSSPSGSSDTPAPPAGNEGDIGEEQAKSIALTDAGLTESQVTFIRVHLDRDDGRQIYDVEFFSGDTEYDYEIDALDGRILESDMDIENYAPPSSGSGSDIGEEQAKATALAHAGLSESQVTFIRVHLDRDDGRRVYDVEFFSGDTEYDYEIDALDGRILESDMDIENYSLPSSGGTAAPATGSESYIGEEKAKSVALAHAGLSESQVQRMWVELDRDDGRMIYEVDFRNGYMEYEYEIGATDGAILHSDVEYDD